LAETKGPLHGLRVIDVATLFAGPMIATMFGDGGADVIKVEHPKGDPIRNHGEHKNGVSLRWKVINRNKRCITLKLSTPEGADVLKRLVADADVLIENFRPGTLEGWGLGWDVLHKLNPRLVMVRVTGFGQEGPYSNRPGFGTIAEAISGFAHVTGEADGPPTLPPFAMGDGVCAMAGTWATMFALYHRDVRGGEGQMIDMAIYEPLLSIIGAQPTIYDQIGVIQGRTGNRSVNNAPRNTYKTKDERWVAISTSSDNIVRRVMRLVGRPDVIDEPWFKTGRGRVEHADELDAMVGGWIAQRDLDVVLKAFEEAEAAIGPIYDASQIVKDPHFLYRQSIIEVQDPDLGPMKMQNVMAKLSGTPASIRWTGPGLGAHNQEILEKELGLTLDEMATLRLSGTI